ncbi:MAG: trigger factor [candidate division KSB1 bacterium]|nr:trigger factor [candidate division KSB1 bacterium]
MQVDIQDREQWQKEITITFPAESVVPRLDEAYARYQKRLNLQGFRKGKVPRSLLRDMFGKEIEGAVFEQLVEEVYPGIIAEYQLKPVGSANITETTYEPDKGLKVTLIVDVEPDIRVERYKGLTVEHEVYQVGDRDVDEMLEKIRRDNAMVTPVEGGAELGDIVAMDVQRLDRTGVPILGERYEDRRIELRESPATAEHAAFSHQLLGARVGERRRVRLVRQAPPSKPNEAPRQVEDLFEVTIKEVLRRELPEIDDELAKDVGEFGSLKELRAYLKQELERQYAHEAQEQLRHRLMDEVIKANSFEAPAHMVELYLDGLVEAARKRSMRRLDEKALREQLRADAIWWVKWQLIRDQIARAEGIEVSEEEVERAVAEAREQHPGEQADDRARRRIKHDLLEQKVLDLIARHAKIKERKVKHRERASVPLVVTPDEA